MADVASDKIMATEEKIFEFPAGLYGLPTLKRFVVCEIPGGGDLFRELVAVDDPTIGFTIVNPAAFFPNYAPEIPEAELQEVGARSADEVLLYVVAIVPAQVQETTVNLRAPLIFNPFTRKGRQVILADERYKTRERLFQV